VITLHTLRNYFSLYGISSDICHIKNYNVSNILCQEPIFFSEKLFLKKLISFISSYVMLCFVKAVLDKCKTKIKHEDDSFLGCGAV
jgi:hypothetical protein